MPLGDEEGPERRSEQVILAPETAVPIHPDSSSLFRARLTDLAQAFGHGPISFPRPAQSAELSP